MLYCTLPRYVFSYIVCHILLYIIYLAQVIYIHIPCYIIFYLAQAYIFIPHVLCITYMFYLAKGLDLDVAVDRAEQIFAELDDDHDGEITESEFIEGCLQDEVGYKE